MEAEPEEFELVPLAGGINSLRSRRNGQTFHPVIGPQKEAEAVHVAGTRLAERFDALRDRGELVVWDVGLGAAANALTAIRALQVRPNEHGRSVQLLSFDHGIGALEFALANAAALGYPLGFEPALESLAKTRAAHIRVGDGLLNWSVVLGDFPSVLATGDDLPAPQAVFYDPYSPGVNREMWTLETFGALLGRTRPDTPCLLTTYTRSTAVRVTLLLAGWHVGVGGATGEKDETTTAANVPGWLDHPLPVSWLEGKVYASTNAAPVRASDHRMRGPISEADFARLRAHPQFTQAEGIAN